MAVDPDKGEEKEGKRQGNDNGKQNARGGRPRDGRPAGKVATGSSELGSGGPHNNGLQKQAEASASRPANADDKVIKRSQSLLRGASQKKTLEQPGEVDSGSNGPSLYDTAAASATVNHSHWGPPDGSRPDRTSSDRRTESDHAPSEAPDAERKPSETHDHTISLLQSGQDAEEHRQQESDFSQDIIIQTQVPAVMEENFDEEQWFDLEVEQMINTIMGEGDRSGIVSEHRRHTDMEQIGEVDLLPGQVEEEETITINSPVRKSATLTGTSSEITETLTSPERRGMERKTSMVRTTSGEEMRSKSVGLPAPTRTTSFDVASRTRFSWLALFKRILAKILPSSIYNRVYPPPKTVMSILVTPVKRLEREASKSSKRVHFKLRKKNEAEVFKALSRTNTKILAWNMAMCIPRLIGLLMIGLRLAFCDLFRKEAVWIWHVDIGMESFVVANTFVALVTEVPKNTYPGQRQAVSSLRGIANLYFRHEAAREWLPGFFYHVVSIAIFYLPHTDYHLHNAEVYRWISYASMLPRAGRDFLVLWRYKSASVIDPKIIKSVRNFQLVYVLLFIILSAEFLGSLYYFMARLVNFDPTTWVTAFENTLPFYEHDNYKPRDDDFAPVTQTYLPLELLLILYKGFCRISGIGYEPDIPGNQQEMILSMLDIGLSVYLTSLILGTVLTYVVRRDPMEVAHKERLNALRNYMQKKHVPEDLYETVMRYCEFQFKKSRQSSSSWNDDLVKSLSPSLIIEVANAYHKDLMMKCSKIGRPFHRCSQEFFDQLIVKLYTVHVMPGDHIAHKDEIPRELYFVSSGAAQVVDEHDQVISVIRSDVPDTAPIVGEVPFFLGINYLKAIKASLDGDVELQVFSKQSSIELALEFPDDYRTISENLWATFGGSGIVEEDDENLDKEKLMTKKRIVESTNFKKVQQFAALSKAARSGDLETIANLARQGADLDHTDYDGRTVMHMACSVGRYKVVESLLKLGAQENIKDRWGQTPMSIALASKQQMIITVLTASKKAKLDIQNPELALCTAAGNGDLQQVKRLVEFGVNANLGDYDRRTALHVSAAEGHEKVVEYLLMAQADPNCKDRWRGTPLQDALTGGHIGTAHILKSKGAEVPESFGAGAVCEAAGKGDVPKLRMLHSFGQSLDVGDYDDRYAQHLASAEGRVLAISFLLGISADPNKRDRWDGTPMDDCVRGDTLYHKYCAKLLQGWGGELGTFKGTKEGDTFLNDLEQISIKSIRAVIRRLIDQGLDKECPERMDDQQLLVVMTATVRHMPLVTQLHRNTSVITKEIKRFRTIVTTFVNQIKDNIELTLFTLSKGSRRVPIMDDVSFDVDKTALFKRPRTAKRSGPKSRQQLNRSVDMFSGIERDDNSQMLDSLLLESPAHSHGVVGAPRKMAVWFKRLGKIIAGTDTWQDDGTQTAEIWWKDVAYSRGIFLSADDNESGQLDFEEFALLDIHHNVNRAALKRVFDEIDTDHNGSLDLEEFTRYVQSGLHLRLISSSQDPSGNVRGAAKDMSLPTPDTGAISAHKALQPEVGKEEKKTGLRPLHTKSMANIAKRNNQRTDALLKTLFDSTIPPLTIRDCTRMLKKVDKRRFMSMTEATEGFLDTDDEEELHFEIDSIAYYLEEIESKRRGVDLYWEKHAAKLFNQLALHIVEVEQAFKILHQIMCASMSSQEQPDADPMLSLENVARGLVVMQASSDNLDLDKCVQEVHTCLKPFKLLQTPKARRANKDEASGELRFSSLVAASSTFRHAVQSMQVDEILCYVMKSKLHEFFTEDEARLLLVKARLENAKNNQNLFLSRDKTLADYKFFTIILSGEVIVIRTLDDVEIGRGKCTVSCFFGAFKTFEGKEIRPEEQEAPVKEGGTGVNNVIIKAAADCKLLRIPIANLRQSLPLIEMYKRTFFLQTMLENLASDISNLENLNALVLEPLKISGAVGSSFWTSMDFSQKMLSDGDWALPMSKRNYYNRVPELHKQEIRNCFCNINNLWIHISRGAKTVPKTSVDLIKEFLGESGSQCYDTVFAPMEQPTAPAFFNAESFWFCWVKFWVQSAHAQEDTSSKRQDMEDEDFSVHGDSGERDATSSKGVLTIMVKHAVKLPIMDTFTGKADPYVLLTVDGVTQKTQVKSGTLEPIWNETMQFNVVANRSIVKLEVFDSEAMAADRSMGACSFVVTPNPITQAVQHKLTGMLEDGRTAEGVINISLSFLRGARVKKNIEQKSEYQLFCETENYRNMILSFLPSRRIDTSFFKVPLPVHEREYTKAAGSLAVPLTGLAIKQYLTYLLVEHSHQVDVYSCREFCSFFKRKLDGETSIAYRDIVKIVKERNSSLNNNDLFVSSVLNRHHWLLRGWYVFIKMISCYHLIMFSVRIGFRPWQSFYDAVLLATDLPADCILLLHVLVLLNQGYRNSKSQWVTSRYRIFKNMDWFVVLAMMPLDWIMRQSGMPDESAVWARVNKLLLLFSSVKPLSLVISSRGDSVYDLFVYLFLLTHYCACIYYYLGEKVPTWTHLGDMGQISWLLSDGDVQNKLHIYTYDRELHFGTQSGPILERFWQRYLLSMYWVVSTYTCQEKRLIGDMTPQNSIEIGYVIVLLLIHLSMWRWISGEIANMVMSSDERVIKTREEQDRILKFVSVKAFKADLRDRIQSHFSAIQGNVSDEQNKLLAALSHGLRVELTRLVWRDFLNKVHLFRGCSGQFLEALCVLVEEQHFGPEHTLGTAGDVADAIVILVHGGLETFSHESGRSKKLTRKGTVISSLSCLFGVRQFSHTRVARSGAVCISLDGKGLKEVLQIYAKDEERLHKNALNFYSRDKLSEGSVAFSSSSFESRDSDETANSAATKDTSKTGSTRGSGASAKTGSTKASNKSSRSNHTKGSGSTSNTKSTTNSKKHKKKRRDESAKVTADDQNDFLVGDVSDAGAASSLDENGSGADDGGGGAKPVDDDLMPLMRETEHIPIIKEQLVELKISHALTAASRGEIQALEDIFSSGEIQFNSKDAMGRTPLHIAASEGHVRLVEYLMELRADPTAKDKMGNSAFNDAVRSKHDAVVRVMKANDGNVSFKLAGNEIGVLLCQAAFNSKIEDIKRLVDNGVDPNEADYDGRTAMHLAASEGNMEVLKYLISIQANIMCRDRFNGTPLEDTVRHHFEIRNAVQAEKLLRDHGATLSAEGLTYVVKMCEYAAEGNVENIRVLAENGVDVSLGDYDDRTPLHLAACNGHTAVLEYLLKQESVLVNAVDRFGGTPFVDSIRHGRKGAAALLEEAGCVRTTDSKSKQVINEMIEKSNMKKEGRLRAERDPKIRHVLENSQESKMVAAISDKLSKEIAAQSGQIELISQRLIWSLRGFVQRLQRNNCNIPFEDSSFVKAAEHVLKLVNEMRSSVNNSRSSLMAEMQGDEGAADCLIWRNASKEYKHQARDLDHQMRELIMLAKVAKHMLRGVLKVCNRGQRQVMYADSSVRTMLESAKVDEKVLKRQKEDAEERAKRAIEKAMDPENQTRTAAKRWGGIKMAVNVFGFQQEETRLRNEIQSQRQAGLVEELESNTLEHSSGLEGDAI